MSVLVVVYCIDIIVYALIFLKVMSFILKNAPFQSICLLNNACHNHVPAVLATHEFMNRSCFPNASAKLQLGTLLPDFIFLKPAYSVTGFQSCDLLPMIT